jgi:hypothetical protein
VEQNIMNKIFTLGMVFGAVACLVGAIFTASVEKPSYAARTTNDAALPMLVTNPEPTVTIGEITAVVKVAAPRPVAKSVKVTVAQPSHPHCYDYGMYTNSSDTVHICE